MNNLQFEDVGKSVSFVDDDGVSRKGVIETFPFNNKVDIKDENGNLFESISAENIKK